MFGQFGEQGDALRQQFVTVLKASLASAITDVFVIGTAVIVIALIVTLFLKELPLRRSHGPASVE